MARNAKKFNLDSRVRLSMAREVRGTGHPHDSNVDGGDHDIDQQERLTSGWFWPSRRAR